MNKKIKVGIIFGGKSAEHEISLQSAKNIFQAIDKNKFEVFLIGINKNGQWFLNEHSQFLLNTDNPKLIALNQSNQPVTLIPNKQSANLVHLSGTTQTTILDVAFPVLHGPYGEDGTIQGLLKLTNIPFVGCSVLGSAIGMDKDVAKRLLRDAGVSVAKFVVLNQNENAKFAKIKKQLGLPLFIKPANLGSSVGISKVSTQKEFEEGIKQAFQYDNKIIIEENITGREIECSVLGNENPKASLPGEVVTQHQFYTYEAKYIDENGAVLIIPAKLSKKIVQEIQKVAILTFKTLCCEGMARVDMFLKENGDVVVNEINTIPGFTKISMYPKLWEASGISYTKLITRLINLSIDRFKRDQQLKTTYVFP